MMVTVIGKGGVILRRIFLFLFCCCLLITSVHAAGSVSSMQADALFSSNGSCRMSLVFQITVDSGETDLRFPLPGSAKDITLNGSSAKTSRSDGMRWVELSDALYGPGQYTVNLHYSLPDLISREGKNGLVLELPLISGFSFAIDRMTFSVTLPKAPTEQPAFLSSYHPESTEDLLDYSIDGAVISGVFAQGLKDHETLVMRLPVSEAMFPQTIAKQWSLSYDDLMQYGLLLLAILYWVFFLRCPLPRQIKRFQAPDGITAGELGCCLSGMHTDFSMMLLTWAQLGYLTIELDRHGKVHLHKVMDMGNERSNFEMHCFKSLFGRRWKVDCSGDHFVRVCRKAGKATPGANHYFLRNTGNPIIFRCLTAGIGAVAGYTLAIAFATDTMWQVALSIALVPLGALLSWAIQDGIRGAQLRQRADVVMAVFGCGMFLVLGIWAGEAGVAVFVVLTQLLAGFCAVHGGRRTEGGLQSRNEILGLRKYLKTVTAEELQRILEHNPDYYFDMLPNAMALGVDKPFARQFKDEKMPVCPYLEVAGGTATTAREWNALLRKVVLKMEERVRKLRWQKLVER